MVYLLVRYQYPGKVKRWKLLLKINVFSQGSYRADSVLSPKIFPKKRVSRPNFLFLVLRAYMPAQYVETDSSSKLKHWAATCQRVTLIKALNSLKSKWQGKRENRIENFSSVRKLSMERHILFMIRCREPNWTRLKLCLSRIRRLTSMSERYLSEQKWVII